MRGVDATMEARLLQVVAENPPMIAADELIRLAGGRRAVARRAFWHLLDMGKLRLNLALKVEKGER